MVAPSTSRPSTAIAANAMLVVRQGVRDVWRSSIPVSTPLQDLIRYGLQETFNAKGAEDGPLAFMEKRKAEWREKWNKPIRTSMA